MSKQNLNLEDILTDRVVEEDFLEVPLSDRVFKIFFSVVVIIIIGIAVQIAYLGFIKNDFYARRAVANMSDVKIQAAPRGVITDRFGKPLVRNEAGFNVFLAPHELPENAEERIQAIRDIGQLVGISEDEIREKLSKKDWNLSEKLFLVNKLSQEQLVAIASEAPPGLILSPTFRRIHEVPYAFSHLVGYTGLVDADDLSLGLGFVVDDEIGRTGLEAYYDSELRGVNGEDIVVHNARGEIQESRITKLPQPGSGIKTFIDRDLQEYFYTRLKQALEDLGRNIGVGIALNPQNGEVLALVNIPGFDEENIQAALKNPYSSLFNRAVSGLYNPGSTIKPLVGTAALTEGVIAPQTQILSTGFIEVPNQYDPTNPSRFLDWKAHGLVDMRSALARSSNVYFYEVGGGFGTQKGLGIERLKEWWHKFGLEEKTGIDLNGEKEGFLPDPEWKEAETNIPWRLGDTYNVSIGQGDLLVTPLELLNYIAAVANGGILYKPRIMDSIVSQDGGSTVVSSPEILKDFRDEVRGAISLVGQGMRDAVTASYGTAHLLSDLPIEVAAKTGTAQIQNNAKTNAFFVGYAPIVNPTIAIIVLIENSREGSLNTIPVARDIFLWYYNNRVKSDSKI